MVRHAISHAKIVDRRLRERRVADLIGRKNLEIQMKQKIAMVGFEQWLLQKDATTVTVPKANTVIQTKVRMESASVTELVQEMGTGEGKTLLRMFH